MNEEDFEELIWRKNAIIRKEVYDNADVVLTNILTGDQIEMNGYQWLNVRDCKPDRQAFPGWWDELKEYQAIL